MRNLRNFGRRLINVFLIGCLCATALPSLSTELTASNRSSAADTAMQSSRGAELEMSTLSFESNQGQWDSRVKFISRAENHIFYLTTNGTVMQLGSGSRSPNSSTTTNERDSSFLKMSLVGSNASATLEGTDSVPRKSNYIIGNDPAKWRNKIANYAKVKQRNVYPGIDLIYRGKDQRLEYDFIVSPRADYNRIVLDLEGASRVAISDKGDLIIDTRAGEIRQRKPFIYQEENGIKNQIAGRYQIKGKHRVGFTVSAYDRSKPLVIDPEIVYSTYLGGAKYSSGFGKRDYISAITVDAAGNTYVAGTTNSIDFPVTPNAFQSQAASAGAGGTRANDAFISAFDPTGHLIYSTYLGGRVQDGAIAIATDSLGNIYVSGVTGSPNFPTTPGAFRNNNLVSEDGRDEAFLVKLNSSGALVYATMPGISSGITIAVDSVGNAYLLGVCVPGFPIVNGLQRADRGVLIAKLNPAGSRLLYSTYLDSGHGEAIYGHAITVDSAGNAYISGETYSQNFVVKNGAWSTKREGAEFGPWPDIFVAKIDTTKSGEDSLLYSTYLPGSGGYDIALGASGCVYVSGDASPHDFPRKTILKEVKWNEEEDIRNYPYDLHVLGFVAKIDPRKSGDSSLIYCTFNSRAAQNGRSIALDAEENVYLAGGSDSWERWLLPVVNASFGGGVFVRSSDDGQTFDTLGNGLPNTQLRYLAIDPKNPSIIFASQGAGLSKSTDGGFNWVSIDKDTRIPVHYTHSIAIDPQTPSTVYVGLNTAPISTDEQVLADVFKSTDGGQSWKPTPLAHLAVIVRALAIDPVNPKIIYAGVTSTVGDAPSIIPRVAGVFKSTDGGDSWSLKNNGLNTIDVNALAIDPGTSSTIYAGTRSGFFKSTDGGDSWLKTEATNQVLAIAIDSKTPSKVYASLVDPSFSLTSVDGRGNPRRRTQSDDVSIASFDPKLEGIVKSTDGGATWGNSNAGFDFSLPVVHDIKISPQDSSVLYLATEAGIYTSRNSGQSWSRNQGMSNFVSAIAVHPRAKSVFYAVTAVATKAYIAKLSADGTKLMYASYLGGNDNDIPYDVALDKAGNLLVVGTTHSWNFPTVNALQSEMSGEWAAFITKISGLDRLPEPKEPEPIKDIAVRPRISSVSINGKKLVVQGDDFSMGAAILVNGVEQNTSNDAATPATRLMSKKAGKKIRPAQEVMVEVRNPDGVVSETFRFVRNE
jgi:photosystem II stability/assembly factor-like uncharacterized protein